MELEFEGKWGVIFLEVKEVGLKPSGQPTPTKKPTTARENRPIFKPAWKPRGSFMGHIRSIQKPSAQQPTSSLQHNHVRSPLVVFPYVPSVSSLSQADPKSHIPVEVVPVNMVVISSDADEVACSDIGKPEFAIQNPKVSFDFLEPQVLNPVPTPLSKPVLVNEVHNYEKPENPHVDLLSTPQISTPSCTDMVVSKSNSDVDNALVQQQIKQLLFDNVVDSNKLWGFSDKWVLELGDGKRVVVSMEFERQPSGFFKGSVLDELNAMDYSGNSSRPLEVQSEWVRVVVENVDFESWSEEDGEMVEFDRRGSDISEPLNVIQLAISKSIETQEVDNLSAFLEDGQFRNH